LLYLITGIFKAGVLHYVTCCERRFAQIITYMRGVREECHKRTDWVRALRARTNREACRGARCGSDSADNGRIKWQDALDCLVWTAWCWELFQMLEGGATVKSAGKSC